MTAKTASRPARVKLGADKAAVRQPGNFTKSVPKQTNAGSTGNVGAGIGSVSNARLSGAERGGTAGNAVSGGGPSNTADPSKPA